MLKSVNFSARLVFLLNSGHSARIPAWKVALAPRLTRRLKSAHSRISQDLLKAELNRIEKIGGKFVTNCKFDAAKFSEICDTSDAVLVAVGGHKARYFSWEGAELLTFGIEFLKAINCGEKPHVGKKVVVIGGSKTLVGELSDRS